MIFQHCRIAMGNKSPSNHLTCLPNQSHIDQHCYSFINDSLRHERSENSKINLIAVC